ncbi:MAG: 1-acyl-sn-glycerol-3-phosphate acyltransferase [Lachnospiraceae bacterium]|nr:1-acyl-sn-glycerol-3-phosphate acyltransferase [Lachnospiraceae bacterium]
MRDFERFDMARPPVRTKWYLRPLTYILSMPDVWKHKNVLTKTGVEEIKPPFVLLCNHNAFMDFKVATKAIFPWRANYVVAIDGFLKREWLLRDVGCICKRKFTSDIMLVKQLMRTIKNGDVAVIYPEARYSLCGTTAVLPESLGKLCKLLKVPVVTLICHGHHVNSPFWNLHDRGVKPTEAEFKLLFGVDELKGLSVEEINRRIVEAFQYDDFKWQKDKGIKITYKGKAEGLHKFLYQCPECKTEFKMSSSGTILKCEACNKEWEMTELSELKALSGEAYFSHIPDWYEWERQNVRAEVKAGTYSTGELPVRVDSLPNAKGYIDIGRGTMVHDMNGFRVQCTDKDGDKHEMVKNVPSLYSCHIEYEYLGKFGDCVDLNTLEDTWYVYPDPEKCDFAVTKMALATEELYFDYEEKCGRNHEPGLA